MTSDAPKLNEIAAVAIPGYGLSQLVELAQEQEADPEPGRTLEETTNKLKSLLFGRDQVAFLARTGLHLLHQMAKDGFSDGGKVAFEQAEAELLQSFALMADRHHVVPTSPANFRRAWDLARRNLRAFSGVMAPAGEDANPEKRVSRQARVMTLHYRNIFNSEDAKEIVPALLMHMDRASVDRLGYRLSDVARAMMHLFEDVPTRIQAYFQHTLAFHAGSATDEDYFVIADRSAMSRRLWTWARAKFPVGKGLASAAFQISEMGWGPVFTYRRDELEALFGTPVTEALFRLSLRFGELAGFEERHLYLGSPIRQRPFIRLDDDLLFLPLPALLISFPFEMVEHLIGEDKPLAEAYASARTDYLEEAVEDIVRKAMPSASVYRAVSWHDDANDKIWENDVVAVFGNHIILFEAKSGKLKQASRRGGTASLRKNFKQLYVEPGRQAARLEMVLRARSGEVLRDKNGKPLPIDLSNPVVVHSFAVCIEHFASMTSSRRLFEEMGLIKPEDPWSPILSIGDLRMISAYLDTEVAFFHYLTRRATIESVIEFMGDEQDLLSVYLTNGFQIDSEALRGTRVVFGMADAPVRGLKTARENRGVPNAIGVQLPGSWQLIVNEIYGSCGRHRFDVIETILNQHPANLKGIERRVRGWRSGTGKAGALTVSTKIGNRTFALVVILWKEIFLSEAEWHSFARERAREVHEELQATECVVLLRHRKSSSLTYDAMSFFRMNRLPALAQ